MINALLKTLTAFANLLEAAADKQTLKTQAKLAKAAVLVTEANAHRKAASFARKVSSSLRDIQAP